MILRKCGIMKLVTFLRTPLAGIFWGFKSRRENTREEYVYYI